MNLQTKILLEKQSNNLMDYNSRVLLLGSCFSENIGEKFTYFKFKSTINPFGILFHSQAIEILILNAIHEKKYNEKDIFFLNEQWHCFDAHSKLSNPSKEVALSNLNNSLKLVNQQISKSTHIIITLGTAWVYRFVETNRIVANCHKVPQRQFSKELMTIDNVVSSLKTIISFIKSINSKAIIIFTVSPVRHLKDGFVENTQSKAHLIAAIHSVLNENIRYFPSYEIMMDELRDYRFYAEDMIHPNSLAIDHIWEKFKQVWFSEDTDKIMDEVDAIQKGLQHKPFNPKAEAHQLFLQKLKEQQKQLQSQYSHIVFK